MQIAVSETELVSETVTELTIDDKTVTGSGKDVLATLSARVESVDPDVLFLNTSVFIPVLFQQLDRLDVKFQLVRRPGWQQLAGESTYESYGQVGPSPARYNLPGRVIIDGSNTFMWNQTNSTAVHISRRTRQAAASVSVVVDWEYSDWDPDPRSL